MYPLFCSATINGFPHAYNLPTNSASIDGISTTRTDTLAFAHWSAAASPSSTPCPLLTIATRSSSLCRSTSPLPNSKW